MKTSLKFVLIAVVLLSIAAVTKYKLKDIEGIVPTLTPTELNYVDGVTSSIQTQLNGKGDLSSATELTSLVYTKSQTMAIPIQDGVQHSHTGNTTAAVVYSDTLPANSITAYGKFKVESLWTSNNSVGTKTCTVYMRNVGGSDTSISSATLSGTTIVGHAVNIIRMRNSLTSQISYSTGIAAGYGTTTAATKTYTIDFAQPVIFTFSITLGTGTDNAALEGCSIEIFNGRYQ